MAIAVRNDAQVDTAKALATMVRAMYPHPSFPDGPYERCGAAIDAAAGNDVRLRTQIDQGLRDLDAARERPFAELDADTQLAVLREIETTEFFQGVRAAVITSLYDDKEVWSLLGYEGPVGIEGYRHSFDDLDWLPEPRIEEHPDPMPEVC